MRVFQPNEASLWQLGKGDGRAKALAPQRLERAILPRQLQPLLDPLERLAIVGVGVEDSRQGVVEHQSIIDLEPLNLLMSELLAVQLAHPATEEIETACAARSPRDRRDRNGPAPPS